ncbi:MAG: DNA cytosine methyltransferase [Novosphingobium sp.]|nr:DNA cytosine methyltransferase [Novosphingobium sp.]
MDVSIIGIGENKGAPRVWLQGQSLARAGFTPRTRYTVSKEQNGIVLRKQLAGPRMVSSKLRSEKETPIIDINNGELLALFEGLDCVRVIYREDEIYILPQASDQRARERVARATQLMETGEPLQFGSLAHGIGVMDEALAAGFAKGGISTELKFSNEIRADFSDHVMEVGREYRPSTIGLNGRMQELAFDEYVMKKVGQCDVLSSGIPCSGASVAGRAKRKLVHPESHPEVGHLVLPIMAMVPRFNPLVIVLECVVSYLNSSSMEIIRTFLIEMGYSLYETVVDGADWNALEHRKRMVVIGVTKGLPFSLSNLTMPAKLKRTLSEILEHIPEDDARWKTMQGLKDKEVRDAEAGKSFAMQVFTATDEKICTLTKGIQKNRSTAAKIQHPTNPDLLRIPTAREHARAKNIPVELIGSLPEGLAHEGLGQSVIYDIFVSFGQLLANTFKSLMFDADEPVFQLAA